MLVSSFFEICYYIIFRFTSLSVTCHCFHKKKKKKKKKIGDDNGNFEMDSITGDLYTAAAATIDFETTSSYTLTVTASEGGEATNVTIKVNILIAALEGQIY